MVMADSSVVLASLTEQSKLGHDTGTTAGHDRVLTQDGASYILMRLAWARFSERKTLCGGAGE